MNFARKQMESMGWTEGKGLGAKEEGMVKPIKPPVQMDTRGLGFTVEDSIQLKNHWWSDAYNVASKGLKAEFKISSVGVIVKAKKGKKRKDDDDDDTKDNEKSASKKVFFNDRFVSSGYLDKEDEEHGEEDSQADGEVSLKKKNKAKDRKRSRGKESKTSIDFNQVFSKSANVTCHKAARLGIKMGGKMKRIEEQEAEYLKKLRAC